MATDVKEAGRNPKRAQREVRKQDFKLQQEQLKTECKTVNRKQRQAGTRKENQIGFNINFEAVSNWNDDSKDYQKIQGILINVRKEMKEIEKLAELIAEVILWQMY